MCRCTYAANQNRRGAIASQLDMSCARSTRKHVRRGGWLVGAGVACWLAVIAVGWCTMTHHSLTGEGPANVAQVAVWPKASHLPRLAGRPTIVLFLHPKCPCSSASVHELERLLLSAQRAGAPAPLVNVAAVTPAETESDWTESPLVARARQMPGAEVVIDSGGREAELFAVTASGTVLLYDATGRLRYRGGVTAGRGHEGPSTGADSLAELLSGAPGPARSFPTFGCRLVAAAPRQQ
jgi:hypothetical protein